MRSQKRIWTLVARRIEELARAFYALPLTRSSSKIPSSPDLALRVVLPWRLSGRKGQAAIQFLAWCQMYPSEKRGPSRSFWWLQSNLDKLHRLRRDHHEWALIARFWPDSWCFLANPQKAPDSSVGRRQCHRECTCNLHFAGALKRRIRRCDRLCSDNTCRMSLTSQHPCVNGSRNGRSHWLFRELTVQQRSQWKKFRLGILF